MHSDYLAPWLPYDSLAPCGRRLALLPFGGGSSGPSEAELKKQQEEQEKANEKYLAQLESLSKIELPEYPEYEAPEPPLPSAPPASISSAEAESAAAQARREAQKRKGILSTIVAGESGTTGGILGYKGKLG